MASAVNRFGVQLVRQSFRTRPVLTSRQLNQPASLHRSAPLRANKNSQYSGKAASAGAPNKGATSSADKSSVNEAASVAEEPAEYIDHGEVPESAAAGRGFLEFQPGLTRDEQSRELDKWREILENPPEEVREAVEQYKRSWSYVEADMMRKLDAEGYKDTYEAPEYFMENKFTLGLFAEGEDDPSEAGEDEEFEGDDITSLAHGTLDQHREIRHYARLAAWELPLLSKFAKKYEPPGKDRPLRFRYTSYMGEEHPAEKKIVVEFCTADLPLTPEQRLKLVKLVGPRYDPQKDLVKMSCEMFENAAQNKRYLGDLVNSLITEAKNESMAEGGKDAFADLPPDFRHVKWKKQLAFPDSWKLDNQRKISLALERAGRMVAERKRIEEGNLVDGNFIVEEALREPEDYSYAPAVRSRSKAPPRLSR